MSAGSEAATGATPSGEKGGPASLARRLRSVVWVLALVAALVLTLAVVPYVVALPGQYSDRTQTSWGTFELSPSTIDAAGDSVSHVTVEIFANLTSEFSGSVSAYESVPGGLAPGIPLVSEAVSHASSFVLSFSAAALLSGPGSVELFLGPALAATFSVELQSSVLPMLLLLAAIAIPLLYTLGVWWAPVRPKWMLVGAIPFYLVAATLFGQRSDLLFMMSSGIRLLDHVNPYIPSAQVPVNLKWVYPPLFVGYSGASAALYHLLTGATLPANGGLNFGSGVYGNSSFAWKALVMPQLPAYYLLIKLPMILAAIGTYFLLRDRFKIPGAEKLWLLNPAIILIGVVWGQLDVLGAFFLALSILYLRAGNTFAASASAALGAAIKIFPALLLPFILLSSKQKAKDTLPILLFAGVSIGLYALSGNVLADLSNLLFLNAQPHIIGSFVANGITWEQLVGASNFPPLVLYVFLPFYTYEVLRFWKAPRDVVPVLLETFLLFFLLNNFVNPQYFIYPILLFILARKTTWALIFSLIPALSVTADGLFSYFVNPYLSYNYFASPFGQGQALVNSFTGNTHLFVGIILAATFVYLYAYYRSEGFQLLAGDLRQLRDRWFRPSVQ